MLSDICYLVVGEPDGIVAVSDVEVEGDAPHDDEPHVDLDELPADGAAGPHHGVGVLHHHHLSEMEIVTIVHVTVTFVSSEYYQA